jgi:RNA polymerase sigma-70 factor (ECF subfamily)
MVEVFVERRPAGVGEPCEEEAFAELYNRTYAPLVAYCRRYCPPGYDAEDIAQEALSRAWSSWDRYSPSRPFWPWVATIARRLCVDYWRRDERAIVRSGGAVAFEPVAQARPDELSEAADECRMAVTAFRGLRPDHQRIVGLRDIEGWSYEDIARFEGVTVESIRGSLRRARLSLRKSYESLAKGGVPALFPIGLVRAWQAARNRMALRMARWQAALHDTGVASTRLGEALVSLMALSVAAVGMGAPSGTVVRSDVGGGGSATTTPGAGVPRADAGAGAPASSGGTASIGGGDSAGAGVVPQWVAPSAEWKPANLLPTSRPSSTGDAGIYNFTTSPNFAKDRTVFAAGMARADCSVACGVLFKSVNAGETWTSVPAVGFLGDRIMIPPAYSEQNPRIFASGNAALQVSDDGGRTFTPITTTGAPAVMSPAFSTGDPRIFLGDAPGRQYDDRMGATTPLGFGPDVEAASQRFSFAFPSDYSTDSAVTFVGVSTSTIASPKPGKVFRCERGVCGSGVELAGTVGAPTLLMGRGPSGDVLYAYTGNALMRSTDGGRSFVRLALPDIADGVASAKTDGSGRVFLLVNDVQTVKPQIVYSENQGRTWVTLPTAGIPEGMLTALQPLGNGTVLVGLNGQIAGLACTHTLGRTWDTHC